MTKYIINKGYGNQHSVESKTVYLKEGFFFFVDSMDTPVMIFPAGNVITIQEQPAT